MRTVNPIIHEFETMQDHYHFRVDTNSEFSREIIHSDHFHWEIRTANIGIVSEEEILFCLHSEHVNYTINAIEFLKSIRPYVESKFNMRCVRIGGLKGCGNGKLINQGTHAIEFKGKRRNHNACAQQLLKLIKLTEPLLKKF